MLRQKVVSTAAYRQLDHRLSAYSLSLAALRMGKVFMKYPTVAEVVAADPEQVCFWWCILPDPDTPEEERELDLIFIKHYVTGWSRPHVTT
jgi:hypothetical protein